MPDESALGDLDRPAAEAERWALARPPVAGIGEPMEQAAGPLAGQVAWRVGLVWRVAARASGRVNLAV